MNARLIKKAGSEEGIADMWRTETNCLHAGGICGYRQRINVGYRYALA